MRYLLFLILIYIGYFLNAQGFRVRHSISNGSKNSTKALFEVSPGNYIGAGFVTDSSGNQPVNCITIVGLGSQGQLLWAKKYKGHNKSYLTNQFIQRCFYKKDNHLYYAGCATDTAGSQIGVLLKFDMNGDTLWQRTYKDSTSIDLIPQMVTASVDNGFLITGFFQNWVTNTQQGLILKTDANGNELWRRKIDKAAPNVQDGKAIVQDSASKKIVIVGYQYLNSNGLHDNLLILDSLGNKVYHGKLCTTGIGGAAWDLIQTKDNSLVMVGLQIYTESLGGYNCNRSFAVKFSIDSPSIPIWKIDGFDKLAIYNAFSCVIELTDGDLLLGGYIDTLQGVWNGPNNQPGSVLTRLTRVSKDGNIKWNRYYEYKMNQNSDDNLQQIHSINLSHDGSWLAAIEGYNFPGVNPFLFVKYDSTGCDSSLSYCADVYSVGLKSLSAGKEKIRVFPNPARNEIHLEIADSEETELCIIDIYGKDVRKEKVTQSQKVDVSDLKAGMYILNFTKDNENVYTTKIIIDD